jgi:hypothetical protein
MSGTHGELFSEIGKLVLAAHAGEAIDLPSKAEELAQRYFELDLPAEAIAEAIARSLGAVSMSMAIVGKANGKADNGNGAKHANGGHSQATNGNGSHTSRVDEAALEEEQRKVSDLFPSGVKIAVLS